MPRVVHLKLPTKPPVVGCELTPYIGLALSDNSFTDQDIPEASPVDGQILRYSWYRLQRENQVSLCSVHPSEPAKLQCAYCLTLDIPVSQSFHCSTECFLDAWPRHRAVHHSASAAASSPGSTRLNSAVVPQRIRGETWLEVSRSKTYVPTVVDIGSVLKFQCTIIDAESKLPTGIVKDITTLQVTPAPALPTVTTLGAIPGDNAVNVTRGQRDPVVMELLTLKRKGETSRRQSRERR